MSDGRLRELERQACSGDRQAMARLLAEEARAGRGPSAATCISRGAHRWFGALLRVRALGTFVGMNVCLDCETPEIEVRRRDIDAKCPPDGVAIGICSPREGHEGHNQGGFHRALRFEREGQRLGRPMLIFRTLCGHRVEIHTDEAVAAWADVTSEPRCGSCARALPDRREEAMRAGPEIHSRLRGFLRNFTPNENYYTETPIDEPPPRTWVNGQWQRKRPNLDAIHSEAIESLF